MGQTNFQIALMVYVFSICVNANVASKIFKVE